MKYLVTEIQKFSDTQISTPTFAFDEQTKAESKFYDIASKAAISSVPVHTVMLYTEEGFSLLPPICYKHTPAPVVEEPTEEPVGE